MRNPVWKLEELLIVLNLYFECNGVISVEDNRITNISNILRKLPCNKKFTELPKFRNEAGVYKKVQNFKSSDPNYKGKGLTHINSLEPIVFKQYINRQDELFQIVEGIVRFINE